MKKTNKNNFTFKAIAGTIIAFLFAISIFVVVDATSPVRQWGPPPEAEGPAIMPAPEGQMMIPNIFLIQLGLSTIMVLLSLYLLFTYIKDYLQLRTKFTIGLIVSIFSFMLFAISANPILHVFLGVYGGRGIFSVVPYLFATISLAVLVWVSSK